MSATTTYRGEKEVNEPKLRINRDGRRWYWELWWDDGDDMGHGVGGWASTKLGARLAARRALRSTDA